MMHEHGVLELIGLRAETEANPQDTHLPAPQASVSLDGYSAQLSPKNDDLASLSSHFKKKKTIQKQSNPEINCLTNRAID